jgi:hypothetical protein
MRKIVALSFAVAVCAALGFPGAAMAQKMHAPKHVWRAMVGGLSDIQSITAAMMVFDMKRAAKAAKDLQAREGFISKMEQLPESVRQGHGKVAVAAAKLVAAAEAGEEQLLAGALGEVMQACNICHYEQRDAARRKKLKNKKAKK